MGSTDHSRGTTTPSDEHSKVLPSLGLGHERLFLVDEVVFDAVQRIAVNRAFNCSTLSACSVMNQFSNRGKYSFWNS